MLSLAGFLFAEDKLGIFEGASDVGNPSQRGSVAFDAAKKEYRVTGGGANIFEKKDDFYFVWRKISGDVTITADLKIESEGVGRRKAGLMLRKSLETAAVYADVVVHGDGLTALQYREKAGDMTIGKPSALKAPTRIRLERRGDTITAWAGNADGTLQQLGSAKLNIGDPVYVGLAVCPHNDKASLTAAFSGVTIQP
jgi:regulation of enolase protein 1 (concanavalin A-like superfamily)